MKKLLVFLGFAAAAVLLLGQDQGNDNAANSPQSVPGELLVQFKPGATDSDKGRALGRARAAVLEEVVPQSRRRDGRGSLALVRHQPDFTPAAARQAIASDPAVDFAEPNWIYTHQVTLNDPYYANGSLWGMYGPQPPSPSNAFGINAVAAWSGGKTDCSSVYIGIIDEGYMYTHEDLAANAGKNPREIEGNGVDDDGNGYVDDVYGWDFDSNDNTVFDGAVDNHGTHVAGTIAAVGGNGRGVAGVCWSVQLLSAKFLGRRGGTTANAVKALDYFIDLKLRQGLNIVATNNSWEGGGFSQALLHAIIRSKDANILFVVAAGNGGRDGSGDNLDVTPSYPASYDDDNIIVVAAITSTGDRAAFSNYGVASVDLGAPGSGVYSTVPVSSKGSIVSGYASYGGTSMAAPHVTGAVALYAAYHPGSSATSIKTAILNSAVATPTPSLAGKCSSGGRLNVAGF